MRTLQLGQVTVDLRTGRFERPIGGGTLTRTEIALLTYLADRPEQAVSHDDLLHNVWGYRPGTKTFTVYSTIRRIRQKLEEDPARPAWLCTASGGYLLRAPEPDPEPLVGRDDALAWLEGRQGRWSTLTGAPGAGTTRLARELHRRSGGAWVDASALSQIEVAAAVREASGLLVLDGALPNLDWSKVPSGWVIATACRPLGAAGEASFRLGPLGIDDAVGLIRRLCPNAAAEGLRDLVMALDRLPLVLSLLAEWMAVLSVEDLTQAVRRPTEVLTARGALPGLGDRYAAALGAVAAEDRLWIERLAIFEGPFAGAAASEIAASGNWLGDTLTRLHTQGLLEQREDGRFWMLRCLRDVCDRSVGQELETMHLQHFAQNARSFSTDEGADLRAALEAAFRLARPLEAAALLQSIAASGTGEPDFVDRLATWLERWPDHQAAWEIRTTFAAQCRRIGKYRRGIAILDRPGAPPSAQVCLGTLRLRDGEHEQGEQTLRDGLARARETRDLPAQGSAWLALGVLAVERSDNPEAERCFREAIDISRAAEVRVHERRALNNLGHMLRRRGDMARAEACYRRGLTLCAPGPSPDRALLTSSLGIVSLCVGRPAEALPLFAKVEALQIASRNRLWQGHSALNRGLCHLHLEDFDAADDALERSRRLALTLRDTALHILAQSALGQHRWLTGDARDATYRLEAALSLAESERRGDLVASVLAALALCDRDAGRAPRFAPDEIVARLGGPMDIGDAAASWLRLAILDAPRAAEHLATADRLMKEAGIEGNVGLVRLRRRLTKSAVV